MTGLVPCSPWSRSERRNPAGRGSVRAVGFLALPRRTGMSRRTVIWLGALVVVSLAIGVFWTIRLAPPSPSPWWWGKDPEFHVEVWEPGKELATVAMTVPKK